MFVMRFKCLFFVLSTQVIKVNPKTNHIKPQNAFARNKFIKIFLFRLKVTKTQIIMLEKRLAIKAFSARNLIISLLTIQLLTL